MFSSHKLAFRNNCCEEFRNGVSNRYKGSKTSHWLRRWCVGGKSCRLQLWQLETSAGFIILENIIYAETQSEKHSDRTGGRVSIRLMQTRQDVAWILTTSSSCDKYHWTKKISPPTPHSYFQLFVLSVFFFCHCRSITSFQWLYHGGQMRLDYNGHQTSGRSWQVDSPNGNFKPCCPLAAWSQRKPKYRAASSTRWTYLTTFTTPSWCLSLSLGRWASWSTLWLFLPSIGGFACTLCKCVLILSWLSLVLTEDFQQCKLKRSFFVFPSI